MPLNKSQLVAALTAAFNQQNSASAAANAIADAIDAYVKTGTVTVAPGIVVTTSSGPGTTTSQGTGTIS